MTTIPDQSTGLSGELAEAIQHAVAATDPIDIGDHHLLVRMPSGYVPHLVDVRDGEEIDRYVHHCQPLVGVDSLARYVEVHRCESTRAYLLDVYGSGTAPLVKDTNAMTVVIDDHLADNIPNHRGHQAVLVLRPTNAARRWGKALSGKLSQEQFLDLVVEGITEIVAPDGAVLRGLVSDLHAIRTTEVQSVIRTGGNGSIQLAENVRLSAGTGDKIDFPEIVKITLTPFAGIPATIALDVQVRPSVAGQHVHFELRAPTLEDEIARVLAAVAADFTERTGLTPFWVP